MNPLINRACTFDKKILPQATFVSTAVKKDGEALDITGNLTFNGVTKPVMPEAKLIGQGDDLIISVEAVGKISVSLRRETVFIPGRGYPTWRSARHEIY